MNDRCKVVDGRISPLAETNLDRESEREEGMGWGGSPYKVPVATAQT